MKRIPAARRPSKIYSQKPPDWPVYGETGTGFIVPRKGLRMGTGIDSDAGGAEDPTRWGRRKRGRPAFAPWFEQRAKDRLTARQMPKRPTLNCFAEELLKEYIKTHPNECPPVIGAVRNMVREVWNGTH
jgi:hypothetical protein